MKATIEFEFDSYNDYVAFWEEIRENGYIQSAAVVEREE